MENKTERAREAARESERGRERERESERERAGGREGDRDIEKDEGDEQVHSKINDDKKLNEINEIYYLYLFAYKNIFYCSKLVLL